MNKETKKPERAPDILAEMRKAVVPMICGRPKIEAVTIRDVLQWADRIEAAYKREHAEWHAETDAAKEDRNRVACRMRREFAEKCRNCTERAPGNAAALRAAIQRLLSLCDKSLCKIPISLPLAHGNEAEYAKLEAEGKAAMDGLRAALAAPARNCDVGTVEDQAKRQSRFCMSQAGRCTTCPADRPTHNACVLAWAQMPFAPTEGGAEC